MNTKSATLGSQQWLQILINKHPEILNHNLRHQFNLSAAEVIRWRSPLEADNYREYQIDEILGKLNLSLASRPLDTFWPKRGPVWDAVGTSEHGVLFLVEAKAHIPEMASPPTQAAGKSLELILSSLAETRTFLSVNSPANWASTFYQYTNRLAHLYLLRALNNLPVLLVFIYFLNAEEMKGPRLQEEWDGAITLMHTYLGLGRHHKLSKYVVDVFVDVNQLL